jgi:hypothetical protein
MNGFKTKALVAGWLAAGLLSLAGCSHDFGSTCGTSCADGEGSAVLSYDPCWPQRWNNVTRAEVHAPLAIQAANGLVQDHTLFNYHFVPGTPELSPMGQMLLTRLARRRPFVEQRLYLQTAHDIAFEPGKPEAFANARTDLDGRRRQAVLDYLAAQRPDLQFDVLVVNPSPVGMSAREAGEAATQVHTSAVGVLPGSGGFGGGVPVHGLPLTGAAGLGGTGYGPPAFGPRGAPGVYGPPPGSPGTGTGGASQPPNQP